MARPSRRTGLVDDMLFALLRRLVAIRYDVRVDGRDAVAIRGRAGILFLPNHPALIDPVILMSELWDPFRPSALADERQIDRFVVRDVARRIGVQAIPDVDQVGAIGRDRVARALADCADALAAGGNLLLYPAGHLAHENVEDLGSKSAVESILRRAPDARVVLVRTRGLWGSRFSWASGREPAALPILAKGLPTLVGNGLFFGPRRRVDILLREAPDLPRDDRATLNRALEAFYNDRPERNTFWPLSLWAGGGPRVEDEPERLRIVGDVSSVPPSVRELVTAQLVELSGVKAFDDDARLGHELGLDSLARAELASWIAREFGTPPASGEALHSVADVLLAASGDATLAAPAKLVSPSPLWWRHGGGATAITVPDGDRVTDLFLAQARSRPDEALCADQTTGCRSYRDMVLGIFALRDALASLPGDRLGIMLPASVGADLLWYATCFAGKVPVQVNWTVGPRNVLHGLELTGTRKVLSSKLLVETLEAQGTDFGAARDRLVFVEDLRRRLPPWKKVAAWARSRLTWRSLAEAPVADTAAVLFTSGSESLPKAVPLSHGNLLANLRDIARRVPFVSTDVILGMLPPFHSFGLMGGVVLPAAFGLRVVHHPKPTDAGTLARLVEAYGATVMIGTPTFLHGIVRAGTKERLASLRLAVTGAERCSERVYEAIAERIPHAAIVEGYGITECSPVVTANDGRAPVPYTIGRAMDSVDWTLVDVDDGHTLGPGETGMLLVRGPSIFSGYLGKDAPDPFVEHDGKRWYRTGDLVSADETGLMTFRGRLKRFVKLGGEMISLPAVEKVLLARFGAAEAEESEDGEGPPLAVEATADEEHPELVLFATADLDRAEVNACIRDGGLSPLHNIRRIVRVEAIPLLGTGKTDYRSLKELLARDGSPTIEEP